ncbi:hypothetical protein J4G48_0029790 [Bradyrhizobium barranii subsp. apii]|uniref:hypothetical protein n=1 Tax=Bradyrhizobium barranii TaxID=2992140 RepID=UPI001AA1A5B3|nr:hypothetical protein [Bradyrhizobium barranii]UPT93538.1 hypothetical protein J4G48_0029790 [Bradyrhizobium barranii subsp. apii]
MNACENFGRTPAPRSQILPPADLNELEKAEFVNVVLGSPPSHFLPADIATIAAYARAVVAGRRAAGELDAALVVGGPNGDRPSPWLPIWLGQLRACTVGAPVEHQPRRPRGDEAERARCADQLLRTHGLDGKPRR